MLAHLHIALIFNPLQRAVLAKNLILKLYGPEKKVDIKDAASDISL